MRTTTLVAFVLAIGRILAGGHTQAGEPINVKVMSFNIRTSTARDGRHAWSARRELVTGLIDRYRGDFVGLQEAQPEQVRDLAAGLKDYCMVWQSRESDPRQGEANPLLYRRDRWSLDPSEHGTFWLSDTPDVPGSRTWWNYCPRIVTWGRFQVRGGNGAVYAYNTHFDHLSEIARQKSALLLLRTIAARRHSDPVVVTGDLNAGESSRALAYLLDGHGTKVHLVDTFRRCHPTAGECGTFHGFSGLTSGPKIDYVLALPGVEVRASEILHDRRDDLFPSDHFPITAELVLPSTASAGQ